MACFSKNFRWVKWQDFFKCCIYIVYICSMLIKLAKNLWLQENQDGDGHKPNVLAINQETRNQWVTSRWLHSSFRPSPWFYAHTHHPASSLVAVLHDCMFSNPFVVSSVFKIQHKLCNSGQSITWWDRCVMMELLFRAHFKSPHADLTTVVK